MCSPTTVIAGWARSAYDRIRQPITGPMTAHGSQDEPGQASND